MACWDFTASGVTKTTKKMCGCCPWVPHSVLFLLMPPLWLNTESFLYQDSDWGNYHGHGLDSRSFYHSEDQGPKHTWHQRNAVEEPCQASPDIYFVLDK